MQFARNLCNLEWSFDMNIYLILLRFSSFVNNFKLKRWGVANKTPRFTIVSVCRQLYSWIMSYCTLYTDGLLIQPITSFTSDAHISSFNNNSNQNLICDIRKLFCNNETPILYFPKIYFILLKSQDGHLMTWFIKISFFLRNTLYFWCHDNVHLSECGFHCVVGN